MSIGPDSAKSDSTQARPGVAAAAVPAAAAPTSSANAVLVTSAPSTSSSPTSTVRTVPTPVSISAPSTSISTPAASKQVSPVTAHKAPPTPTLSPKVTSDANATERPPPPKSAVSLHAAAAAKAKREAEAAAAAAAAASASGPNQKEGQTAPSAVPSASSASNAKPSAASASTTAPAASIAPTNASQNGTGTPAKKTAKAKATKPAAPAKPKQKRKSNQSGVAAKDLVYQPSTSTAGGTIGSVADQTVPAMLPAGGGARRAMPELVLPFQLPYTDIRPEMPMLDNASVRSAMSMGASETTSSPDSGSDSDDYSVLSDHSDDDSEAEESRREARRRRREPATIEESLVLLQSLRQSRLSHLSSLLTPFSQRVRSGMIYPNVLPLSLLHGLNPRDPHVMIPLGRADIQVGPHVFVKTKFWEVRPDYEMPPSMGHPMARMGMQPYGHGHLPQPPIGMQPMQPSPMAGVTMPMSMPLPMSKPSLPPAPMPSLAPTPSPAAATVPVRPAAIAPATSASAPPKAATSALPPRPTVTTASTPVAKLPQVPSAAQATSQATVGRPTATNANAASAPVLPTPAPAAVTAAPASQTTTLPPAPATSAAPKASPVSQATPVVTARPAAGAQAAPASTGTPVTKPPPSAAPAAASSTPSTVKPVTLPVALPRPPMTTPSLPRPPSLSQNSSAGNPTSVTSSTQSVPFAPQRAPSAAPGTSPAAANASNKGAALAKVTTQPTAGTGSAPNATKASTSGGTTSADGAASKVPTVQSSAGAAASTAETPAAASKAPIKPATPAAPAPAGAPSRPQGPPPPPAIDAVLVSRVNATAALNPELQQLLHVAASGKASPTELKALGVWIQAITAQLREDEARAAAAKGGATAATAGASASAKTAGSTGTAPGPGASSTPDGKKTKKAKVDEAAKASKKQAKIEEREAKKKAKAEAKAKAAAEKQQAQKQQRLLQQQQKQQQQQQKQNQQQQQQQQQQQPVPPAAPTKLPHPPPGWPTEGLPSPPVIVVEFRENPSMRFILPLWKCLVERTEGLERPTKPKIKKERRGFFDHDSDDEEMPKIEPELKLSFFAPSLGSDAADGSGLRELEEELKRKAAEEASLHASKSPPQISGPSSPTDATAPLAAATSEAGNDGSSTAGKKTKKTAGASTKRGSKPVKMESMSISGNLEDTQLGGDSKKHEIYPLTWTIKGGVTESLWEAFGRVPGTMTCQPVIKREPQIELEPDVAEFLVPEIRYHLLDLPMEEIKIQKETTETFVDIFSQIPDRRFILPRIAPAMLPQGLEDHLQDKFGVRPQAIQGRPMVKRKAGARDEEVNFSYEGIGLTVIGPNGVKVEPGAPEPPKPPKRKRHVATHNPDGSIKSCGACGKTKTPMWRRGPKGPSQLCNACGARWKAGRLVVPEVAPPPIIEPEEDKTKADAANGKAGDDEDASSGPGNASMHGSNALVIPQSSNLDSNGYTMMPTPSGMAMAASPFGEHVGGGGGPGPYALAEGKDDLDFSPTHLGRGSTSPSPFIRSPVPEDAAMPASVDPSMLSGSVRSGGRK
ncbi:hypothetical protein BCV70DRAFT_71304 [Testicularia cyperi]|uniref:GATA-type domain-containing protein n=1 Tax=Testicularia cyperi TaxID=1882483 RepID=A0A317XH50_9BASI|nr:hypothetical protein BCV70DRAFT_71304 [Testicularia cyperi]